MAAGQSLITPALAALVAARVGRDARGVGLGAQQGVSALARIVGPAVGGLAYGLVGTGSPSWGAAWWWRCALVFSLVMRSGLDMTLSAPESAADGCRRRPPQVTVG